MKRGGSLQRLSMETRRTEFPKKITDDPDAAEILISRLINEQGTELLPSLSAGLLWLLAVSAGANAGSGRVLGEVINKAMSTRTMRGLVRAVGRNRTIFIIKGVRNYGHSVILSKISKHHPRQQPAPAVRPIDAAKASHFLGSGISELWRGDAGAASAPGSQTPDQRARPRR